MTAGAVWWRAYLGPRYWRTWLTAAALRLAALPPYPVQLALGRGLGALMYLVLRRRRRIARVNLALCFPELNEGERRRLLWRHFQALGIAFFELPTAWWGSERKLRALVAEVRGLHHLETALAAGRGAILLGAHFVNLEIGLRMLLFYQRCNMMYRRNKNPLLDRIILGGRTRHPVHVFPRENMRDLVASLRQNVPVWYAPDQNYGRRHSVFVPFFGQPAATITVTSRLARMSGAPVVPFFQRRLPGLRGYELVVLPALENFPSGDEEADARHINRVIEEQVRRSPEQYLWVHRRFKTRPDPAEDVYAG